MAVEEDGFATRATTSCTSSARRLGGSAEMVQKIGKPVVFYKIMLTTSMKPTTKKEKKMSSLNFEALKSMRLVP